MSSTEVDFSVARASVAPARNRLRAPVRLKRRTQAERSDETRGRLIQAAAEVLRRKGYAGLRTEEVSRVAKVSRGAQQHHFPSKDSLVLATASHLLRSSLDRGLARAQIAKATNGDPLDAVIDDCWEFFMGPDFHVILDLVLASTKTQGLREKVFEFTQESRLGVEAAWLDALCAHGVPRQRAEKALRLTISIVRGFSVRALWERDETKFRALLDEWKLIISAHLKGAIEQ